jgi:hypothetical protein
MFAQANILVTVVGNIVMVSLLMSAAALVATMVGELSRPPSVQCCGGAAHEMSIFGVSVPSIGAGQTAVGGNHPALTVILGGRREGQRHGHARGQLALVPARQRSDGAATGAPRAAAGASVFALLRKLTRR